MKKCFWIFLFAISVIACNKDNGNSGGKAFLYKGVEYASLQEAIDAATLSEYSETDEIVMTNDYKGSEAVFYNGLTDYICLNLNGHRCELTSPLDMRLVSFFLEGDGAFNGDINAQDAYLQFS